MREKLEKLLENSYAPYSNMHFACIVETKKETSTKVLI